jgi:hypothetical protein
MFPLLENVSLNADQSLAATRLLLRIAHVDGARTAEEVALIRWFHDSGRGASVDWPAFRHPAGDRAGRGVSPRSSANLGSATWCLPPA